MRGSRLLFALMFVFAGGFVWAGDCGPELLGSDTFQKLIAEMNAGTVFRRVRGGQLCPSAIVLKEMPLRSEDNALEGDRRIRLQPLNPKEKFPSDTNEIFYRPTIPEGVLKWYDRCVGFNWGPQFSLRLQCDRHNRIWSGYNSLEFTPLKMGRSETRVTYFGEGSIIYSFNGPGTLQTECLFEKE